MPREPLPGPCIPRGPVSAAFPSPETAEAINALWLRSVAGLNVQQSRQLRLLLEEYGDIFVARDEDCRRTGLVQHAIDTGSARPIRLRPHRLALAKRQAAEDKVREMAAGGVIEPSSSPWAAPAVLVRKKDGSWRFCVDYRRLNKVTRKDSYPLPRIDNALDYIGGSSWFSSLDLCSDRQVELAYEARPKTAFTIGQGLWQFCVMPFGLCNATATFEWMMERVLVSIPRSRCVVYLDDLLVHAHDFGEALVNLWEVSEAIRWAGLRLNPAKCSLLARETLLLGHVVNEHGMATNPTKAAAVRANCRVFWAWRGTTAGSSRTLPRSPVNLHRLTETGRPYVWDNACATAFARLQAVLTEVLAYPDAGRPFLVDTDASNVGISAVLSQGVGEGEHPVAYFSCTLSRAEHNYCMTQRELLAVFKNAEGQVARWLEVLQGYDFEIQHRAGRLDSNADALSRRPCAVLECCYCLRQEEWAHKSPMVAALQTTEADQTIGEAEG